MIAAALLLGAAAAPAAAGASTRDTRLMVDRYGECIVAAQQRRAREAILANIDNSTLMRRYPQLVDGRCMQPRAGEVVKVQFHGDQFRFAIADALVRKELAAVPAPVLQQVPRLDQRVPAPPSRTDSKGRPVKDRDYQDALRRHAEFEAYAYLAAYGECVVRVDPAAARALLLARPESPQEAAQFAAIRMALATCLPEGRTMALGKLALRGTIAVNYYRLADAAQRAGVGTARNREGDAAGREGVQ